LDWVVEAVLGEREPLRKCVALTCDDGLSLDWHDVVHPRFGWRQSFANILRLFSLEVGDAQPTVEMTSFVVASPAARSELEIKCLDGSPWWSDDWWHDAAGSGFMRIENHSWDHVHPDVTRVHQESQTKGDFAAVESFDDCDVQVGNASAFIEARAGRRPRYFAYPYGQASRYLRSTYFPYNRHGVRAAFSIDHAYATAESDRWYLPRFTHGASDTSTPEDLERILRESKLEPQ